MSCCKRSRAGSGLVRSVDTVARLGGDEFVLLITSIDHVDDAASLQAAPSRRCRRRCASPSVDVRTSPSIGIAFYPDGRRDHRVRWPRTPTPPCTARSSGAAAAFNGSKGDMSAGVEDRVQLESELHNAVALEQFELYYQPKVAHDAARCAAPRHSFAGATRSAG